MAGCVGVGSSTRIGRRCRLGGQVGIAGHVEICDDVTIMAGSGVMKPITRPGVYALASRCSPEEWRRNFAHLRHLGGNGRAHPPPGKAPGRTRRRGLILVAFPISCREPCDMMGTSN